MRLVLSTAERASSLDIVDTWPVPRLHELVDFAYESGAPNALPPGIYRVEGVTHAFGHGTLQVHLGLVWVKTRG